MRDLQPLPHEVQRRILGRRHATLDPRRPILDLERQPPDVQNPVHDPENPIPGLGMHKQSEAHLLLLLELGGPGPRDSQRVDILFGFLREADLSKSSDLQPYIASLREATEERPLAEQIIDLLVSRRPELYPRYAKAKGERREIAPGPVSVEPSAPEQAAIGEFLNAWIRLERTVRAKSGGRGEIGPIPFVRLVRMIKLSPHDTTELRQLQQLRNQVVHGLEIPPPEHLRNATKQIRSMIKKLARRK